MNKKQRTLFLVGILTILIFVIGATYAYFSIGINNTTTDSTVSGTTNKYGTASLTTNTSKLYLKFTNDEMSEDHQGTAYYANSDRLGTPLTQDPGYILATASLADGDLPLDCTYNFKVTASLAKEINDGSDSTVGVIIDGRIITLSELTAAGTDGVIVSGNIKNLTKGNNVTISLASGVVNTSNNQNDLAGNSYTITIAPYNSGDKKAFSCKLAFKWDNSKSLADNLVASGKLWQSGLEGDGYRYVGSGAVGTSTNPNNFICFGTNNKSTCTANQDKYMYRVLGAFSDANGEKHVKLIKYKQLGEYAWHDTNADVNWGDSTLYASLNGSGFLTNPTYDYLQNPTWSNKIENWTWSAVNTKSYEDQTNNTDYYGSSPTGIYLNEMHKTSNGTLCTNYNSSAVNCNGGAWTTPSAKIGLMYASDYALSLGSSALAITGTGTNEALLETGWMHPSNNDTTKNTWEWTLSRRGANNASHFSAWLVNSAGQVNSSYVDGTKAVRPVFYLTSNQAYLGGNGSLDDPFMIQ